MADVLTATAIVAALAVSVIGLLSRANQVARKMANARAATRAAESRLADLQASRPVVPGPERDVSVHPEPGGSAVPGHTWVRVSATIAGQTADVIGLVPDASGLYGTQSPNPTTAPGPRRPATQEGP
jgi:hypothetical protein